METEKNEKKNENLKQLYCVEYPGVVQNVDKAIDNLGGLNAVSKAFLNRNKKLECKFHNGALYRKSTKAEPSKSNGMLMKIIRRKIPGTNEYTYETVIIGKVIWTIKFNNLCDFQYLPVVIEPNGQPKNIYSDVIPTGILPYSSIFKPASLFLVPHKFSRTDTVNQIIAKSDEQPGDTVGLSRISRKSHVIYISHESPTVPSEPLEVVKSNLKQKCVKEEHVAKVVQLFKERPVWTKHALLCKTGFNPSTIKYILSAVAYHFTSGPYRITWARYGYDPRKDYDSRIYQIFDYRTKGEREKMLKSMNMSKKYGTGSRSQDPESLNTEFRQSRDTFQENIYMFKPGFMPPYKQMFYQVCDIQIPEMEGILKKHYKSPSNRVYSSKNGWLSQGFFDEVRCAINKHIFSELSKYSRPLDVPTSTHESESSSDSDAANVFDHESSSTEMSDMVINNASSSDSDY